MARFDIFTDSTCDLTAQQETEHGLIILPTGVTVKGASFMHYPDCRELPMSDFYAAIRAGIETQTFATPPDAFTRAIEPSLIAGRDALVLAVSSQLSSIYQNANIAAQELLERYPERRVIVIDSLCASTGLGLFAIMASHYRGEGMSLEETVAHLQAARAHVCQVFTVDSLRHLRRGGRISAAVAIVGTALSMKPVMNMDAGGNLVATGTARGRKKAIAALAEKMKRLALEPEEQDVFISQADCEADAELLRDMIIEQVGVKSVTINQIGPSVATHGGCGSLALFFIGKHREGIKSR